jgi:hypothetical protein
MRTSGLVLDVYDDFGGAMMRELYPSFDDIPGTVKQAHVVTDDVRQKLPDDVFALVLINNGDKLRKYACIDEGNTFLSVQYFLKNAHKLPLEAQTVAAENLKVACGWYDLEVPAELEKVALGLGTALGVAMAVPTIKGTHQAVKENFAATKALRGQGVNVVSPEMRDEALGRKVAEVNGTTTAPLQGPGDPSPMPSKTVVKKTAQHLGHLVSRHPHAEHDNKGPIEGTAEIDYTHGVQPQKPQAKHLQPTVDTSNKEPPKVSSEKKAELYALPSEKKYPLDSYVCVKAASSYFDTYVRHMPPPTRHEFAVNLVKRASVLAIPVSDEARKYGSEEFAPEEEIKAAFDARRIEVAHNTDALKLLGEVEKVARLRMWKEAFAVTEKGHVFDTAMAELEKEHALERARLGQVFQSLPYHDPARGSVRPGLLDALRFNAISAEGDHPTSAARHQHYVAEKHRAGRNAWNPLGGVLTPLAEEEGGTTGLFSRLGRVRDKEASAQAFSPEEVVALLEEFDKVAGLDHCYDRTVPDPYYSIYGFEKTAQDPEFSEVIGNELVTEADIKRLARIGAHSVKTTFGIEFQEEFLKDPVGIYKSLPLDQRKMLSRMANSTQPGAERTYF